jgi:hypothetical protein
VPQELATWWGELQGLPAEDRQKRVAELAPVGEGAAAPGPPRRRRRRGGRRGARPADA